MKTPLDIFSKQAISYKNYRPTYPNELYNEILKHVKYKDACWDCGTGNGQVASVLSKHFKNVYATDISQHQIALAEQKPNIKYSIQRAEQTNFTNNQFDLITVGQAVHWFDFEAFNKEVQRVAKNDAVLCVWGYGLFEMQESINELVNEFYHGIIGPYWNKERKFIDEKYQTIPFEFEEIASSNEISMVVNWNLDNLHGYFNSWSSVQHYKDAHEGINPVDDLMKRIAERWVGDVTEIKFPLFMRMGRIKK